MHELDVALAVIFATVLLLGLVSDAVERSWLSSPILALGIGVLVGPAALDWLDPARWGSEPVILEQAARLTLAVSLMGVALRVRREDLRALARPVGWLLGLGMAVMWVVSAGLAHVTLGLGALAALLVGAVVTPTDPVVSSAIVTGRFARENLSGRLRDTLSLEAGANDGLAYPFVLLPILLLLHPTGEALSLFAGRTLLAGVLLAVGAGVLVGWTAAHALRVAERRGWIGEHSLLTTTLALSLATLGTAGLVHADALLSVFVAGLVFNACADRKEEHEDENVQEAIAKLFTRPIFVLLGLALPWAAWGERPLAFAAFALSILALRRPLALLALWPALKGDVRGADLLFLGWFGPIGVAALYYSTLAWHETGDATAFHAASAAIVASVVLHGLSAAPLTRWHARAVR